VLLLALLLCAPAAAQKADRPDVRAGDQWRFAVACLIDVEVVAHEKLTVPAGEFDAFRILAKGVLRGTSPIGSRYDAVTTTTYWYAPQARAVVKSVHHNPYLGRSTVQLVDFRPGVR
jgi:hypothetical protein